MSKTAKKVLLNSLLVALVSGFTLLCPKSAYAYTTGSITKPDGTTESTTSVSQFTTPATPATANPATVITFSDSSVEAAVRTALHMSSGSITVGNLQTITTLAIADTTSIQDIYPLIYCSGLKTLKLWGNGYGSVDLSVLRNLPLETLDIRGYTSLDLSYISNITSLKYLMIFGSTYIDNTDPRSSLSSLQYSFIQDIATGNNDTEG